MASAPRASWSIALHLTERPGPTVSVVRDSAIRMFDSGCIDRNNRARYIDTHKLRLVNLRSLGLVGEAARSLHQLGTHGNALLPKTDPVLVDRTRSNETPRSIIPRDIYGKPESIWSQPKRTRQISQYVALKGFGLPFEWMSCYQVIEDAQTLNGVLRSSREFPARSTY